MDIAFAPAADPALANALRQNLKHWTLAFAGHAAYRDGKAQVTTNQPLLWTGAKHATMRVSGLTLSGGPNSLHAAFEANLAGSRFTIGQTDRSRLAMERRRLHRQGGAEQPVQFRHAARCQPGGAGHIFLAERTICLHALGLRASFRWRPFIPAPAIWPKNAQAISARRHSSPADHGRRHRHGPCPARPRDASADLPLATAHVEGVAARLAFDGEGAPRKGTATVTAAQMVDRAPARASSRCWARAPRRWRPACGAAVSS